MTDLPTRAQAEVMMHTLGLDRAKEAYRNYFASGNGHHEQPIIDALVSRGLMELSRAGREPWPDDLYRITPAGREALARYRAKEGGQGE